MLYYVKKRTSRAWHPGLLIALFCAVCTALLMFVNFQLNNQLNIRESYRYNIEVRGLVSDRENLRFDELGISQEMVSRFDGSSKSTTQLSPYLHGLSLKSRYRYNLAGQADSRQCYVTFLNKPMADERLRVDEGQLQYNQGYDEALFSGKEFFCLIHPALEQHVLQENGERWISVLLHLSNWDSSIVQQKHRLKVVGHALLDDPYTILAPYGCIKHICQQHQLPLITDSLAFTLKDNQDLPKFREICALFFVNPKDAEAFRKDSRPWSVIIHDSTYEKSMQAINRSIVFSKVLLPLLTVLTTTAGFLFSYLSLRNRRKELSVLITIGTGKAMLICQATLEQGVYSLCGAVAGWLAFRLLTKSPGNSMFTAAVAVAYLAGATLAAWRFTRIPAISLLKDKG